MKATLSDKIYLCRSSFAIATFKSLSKIHKKEHRVFFLPHVTQLECIPLTRRITPKQNLSHECVVNSKILESVLDFR